MLMSEELTRKQEMFVAEYLVDYNAAQAAIRAGYSRGDARNAGYRLLRRPKIQAAIAAAQAPHLARLRLDADAVLTELARVAQANVLDYIRFGNGGEPIVDLSQIDRDRAAALSELTIEEVAGGGRPAIRRTRFRMHDKLAALDKLARHFGLLRERPGPDPTEAASEEPQHDPRQVARAVLAILETAQFADEAEAEATAGDGTAGTQPWGDRRMQ
jgi:phage terminase small subunit